MECKAELISISKDWYVGGFQIAFHADHVNASEDLDGALRLKVTKWREKRSLSANAYYWVILSAMAQALDTSKEELHEEMLRRYGTEYQDEKGFIEIKIPIGTNINKIPGHWRFSRKEWPQDVYILLKGSSDYDTKEMSHLLDMTIEEAKELGIDTMTPEELSRLEGYERFNFGR